MPIQRASSIHHLRKCHKPSVGHSLTYVENKSRVKEGNCSFRERPSEVNTVRLRTEASRKIRIEPLTHKKPLVINKENSETTRVKTERESYANFLGKGKKEAMKPDQLRMIVKSLRENERQKTVLRLF